jgi:hypothetical protein
MPVKILIALLFVIHTWTSCQPVTAGRGEDPETGWVESNITGIASPALDSLSRSLALIEVAKAREALDGSDFWHRLIPRLSIEAGIGVRDIAFPDAGGTIVFPKDSYRASIGLSLSGLMDGSSHARAALQLAEAEIRYAALVRRQSLARLSRARKRDQCAAEIEALGEEVALRESAVAYQELLFRQGRTDYHALTGARIDLMRIKHGVHRLEGLLRELGPFPPGDPGQ